MEERRCRKALSSPISCSCVRDKADAAFLLCSAPHDERCSLSQYSMRARKNFSDLALLSLQSAPIPRKGKRPSLNLGDDTNFFAQFECAPLSSIIRRGVYLFIFVLAHSPPVLLTNLNSSIPDVGGPHAQIQPKMQRFIPKLFKDSAKIPLSPFNTRMISILFYFIT